MSGSLYFLPMGTVIVPTSEILPGVGDDAMMELPVHAYLYVGKAGEVVLIDTGMHDDHVEDPQLTWRGTDYESTLVPKMDRGDTIVANLARVGLTPDDVTHVINTHLHFDHAGNNNMFRNAVFVVQADQLTAASDRPGSFQARFFDACTWYAVNGEVEVAPGVTVFPTPGHVPGHQSVHISLEVDDDAIICGDAIPCQAVLDTQNFRSHMDPAAAQRSADLLLKRADKSGGRLIYSHDADQAATYREAPHHYV